MFLLLPSFQFYQKFRSDWFQQTGLEATRDPVTLMRSPLRPPPWVAQRSEFVGPFDTRVGRMNSWYAFLLNLSFVMWFAIWFCFLSSFSFCVCVYVCVLDKLLWVDSSSGTTNDNKCVHQGSNKENRTNTPPTELSEIRNANLSTPDANNADTTHSASTGPAVDVVFSALFLWKKGRYQGEVGNSQRRLHFWVLFFFLNVNNLEGFLGSSQSNGLLWWRSLRAVVWSKQTLILGKSGFVVGVCMWYILRIWLICSGIPMSQSVQQDFCGTFGLQVRTTQGKDEQVEILNCPVKWYYLQETHHRGWYDVFFRSEFNPRAKMQSGGAI